MVNFQTLGKFVMAPRPYGPRLHVADAAAFINALNADLGYPKTKVDEKYVRSRGLDKTWHWTRAAEKVARASLQKLPSVFDREGTWESPFQMLWLIEHDNDPLKNHPIDEPETLYRIAGYFKDGFDAFKNFPVDFCKDDTEKAHPASDKYENDIKSVMDAIRAANPGTFDKEGNVLSKDWVQIAIPEDTGVDCRSAGRALPTRGWRRTPGRCP
jgi:hypothetical protein